MAAGTIPRKLQYVAAKLGWPQLRRYEHKVQDRLDDTLPPRIIWYESGEFGGRTACFLQINEYPIGQKTQYEAAVYGIRYRLWSMWHCFSVSGDRSHLDAEVSRLAEWLHHDWYQSLAGRRRFRKLHPECAGLSWKSIRAIEPYASRYEQGTGYPKG